MQQEKVNSIFVTVESVVLANKIKNKSPKVLAKLCSCKYMPFPLFFLLKITFDLLFNTIFESLCKHILHPQGQWKFELGWHSYTYNVLINYELFRILNNLEV